MSETDPQSKLSHHSNRPNQTGADFVALLNDIERKICPSTCRTMGLNYWPMLRFQINIKRKNGFIHGEQELPLIEKHRSPNNIVNFFYGWLSKIQDGRDTMHWLDNALTSFPSEVFEDIPVASVLYLNRKTQYHKIGKSIFQPFTDGLRWLVKSEKSQLTLTKQDPRLAQERFLVPTLIQPKVKLTRPFSLVHPKDKHEYQSRQEILSKIDDINATLKYKAPELKLNKFACLDRFERVAFEIVYYTALLQKVRPKTIFMSSYSGAYYVCVAARYLGINVVDIQHGGMYPDHPLAANWTRTPKQGYEILPDVFWCWSDESSAWISSTIKNYHSTIVGGNPKIAIEDMLEDVAFAPKLPPKCIDGRPRVLVALGYGKNELIPPHVKKAYEATKTSVAWYFRLHPAGRDRISEAMHSLNISAAEILRFSDCTENQAMETMDMLFTDASTIVYRSLNAGLKTAVWSEVGASFFRHLIQDGTLQALVTSDQIVDFVSRSPRFGTITNGAKDNQNNSLRKMIEAFDTLTQD